MFCPHCGTKLKDGAKFCTECGAQIDSIVEAYKKTAESNVTFENIVGTDFPAEQDKNDAAAEKAAIAGSAADMSTKLDVAGAAPEEASPSVNQTSGAKKATLGSFLMQKRQLGAVSIPTFVAIIAALIFSATVAYAVYRLMQEVILPSMYQPVEVAEVATSEAVTSGATSAQEVATTENATTEGSNSTEEAAAAMANLTYESEDVSVDVTVTYQWSENEQSQVTHTWMYPVLKVTNGSNTEAIDRINASIKAYFNEKVRATNSKTIGLAAGQVTTSLNWWTSYIGDSYVCTRISGEETADGSHGNSFFESKFYDLNTGEEITVNQAIGMSEAQLQALAIEGINAFLAANPSDIPTPQDVWHIATMTNYYVTEEGIVYRTSDYELGSYAFGTHAILIRPSENSNFSVGTDFLYREY